MKERRLLSLVIAALMALTITTAIPPWSQPAFAADPGDQPPAAQPQKYQPFQTEVAKIDSFGNVRLALTIDEFEAAGYKTGDMLTVSINKQKLTIPYCNSPS